ncbi:MAG: GIY-YIG nuclease family protein [Nanoarchaeota archaeon]|nr:GIY-YIG nuclease family protein [Nanoarchaeota archaeon]
MEKKWYVYILECLDGSYYTGVTTNIEERVKKHVSGKGSKYIYSKGFKKILVVIDCETKSSACKTEYSIKQLPKNEKLDWLINKSKI